jgi:hypothetical protein
MATLLRNAVTLHCIELDTSSTLLLQLSVDASGVAAHQLAWPTHSHAHTAGPRAAAYPRL